MISRNVNLPTLVVEALAHLGHALVGIGFSDGFAVSKVPSTCRRNVPRTFGKFASGERTYFLRDLPRAELGTAHRAEVDGLGAFCRKRLVLVLFRRFRIERG